MLFFLIGHLYLSSMWLHFDMRIVSNKRCVKNQTTHSKIDFHFNLNNQINWGDLCDHLMNLRMITYDSE